MLKAETPLINETIKGKYILQPLTGMYHCVKAEGLPCINSFQADKQHRLCHCTAGRGAGALDLEFQLERNTKCKWYHNQVITEKKKM